MSDMVNPALEFLTKSKFSKLVEKAVQEHRLSYIDAVIYCCEENKIEVEDSRKYVSTVIKAKLEAEAMSLNFLEKSAELPFD
tara:strand:- start:58 stop:303 length:246 start_codon:yes stop_codon:yes gene_type:complete